MSDRWVADREAREMARTELVRPVLLEAGAGTGKTATLVSRVLAWCLGPGWGAALRPEEESPAEVASRVLGGVVAITFTEAAASEMEERIGGAFAEVGTTDGRASAFVEVLDRLTVTTIHAFCRRLIAAHPIEAGVPPGFAVDADGAGVRGVAREAVRLALEAAYGEPGESPWLELAARGVGPAQVVEALGALLAAGAPADSLRGVAERGAEAFGRELVAAVERLWTAVGTVDRRRFGGGAELLAILESVRARPPRDAEGLAAAGERLRRIARLERWAGGRFSGREQQWLAGRAQRVERSSRRLLEVARLAARIDRAGVEAAGEVLGTLLDQAREGLHARALVPFSGLLGGARRLLAEWPEVRQRERRRIDQLLVDEFQDTDRDQCEIVRWLSLDGPADERPGLFVVGDPKQSIYGWRNADLASYEAFKQEVLAAGGVIRRLGVCFRAARPVLAEVDRIIAPLMVEEPGLQPRYEGLVPSRERLEASGFTDRDRRPVEHWISWVDDGDGSMQTTSRSATELEATAVARDVAELGADGVGWSSIGLLLRATGDLDVYLTALTAAGVPYAVARDRSYWRRREVVDARVFLRTVLDPSDDLALVATLRSPWVGVPDAALEGLWSAGLATRVRELTSEGEAAALEAEASSIGRSLPATIPGLERLSGWPRTFGAFLRLVLDLRARWRTGTVEGFVEGVRVGSLLEVGEAARYLGRWRAANLDRFFHELVTLLETGAGLDEVLEWLRFAPAGGDGDDRRSRADRDAVSVLTIHQAKGLDFDHVYVVGCHQQPRPGRSRHETEARRGPGGWGFRLFGWPAPSWGPIEERERRVAAAERVRLLYVAATRARERLVLVGRPPVGARDDRSLAALLDARRPRSVLVDRWHRLEAAGLWGEVDGEETRWVFPALRPDGWKPEPLPPSAADSAPAWEPLFHAARARARERGERPLRGPLTDTVEGELETVAGGDRPSVAALVGMAVHGALEHLDPGAAAPEEELVRLAGARLRVHGWALTRPEREQAAKRLERLLRAFLESDLWPRWLALGPAFVARELTLLAPPKDDPDGPLAVRVGAADLVATRTDGSLVVIDYKTDEVAPEHLLVRADRYRPQLESYVEAVAAALGPTTRPAWEIWFLAAGRVVVDPGGAARPP